DRAHLPRVVVADGVVDLVARVHDERSLEDDWLTDGPPSENQHIQIRRSRFLHTAGLDHYRVAVVEDGQLTFANRTAFWPGETLARKHIGHGVEVFAPFRLEARSRAHGDVGVGDGRPGHARAFVAGKV